MVNLVLRPNTRNWNWLVIASLIRTYLQPFNRFLTLRNAKKLQTFIKIVRLLENSLRVAVNPKSKLKL